MLVQLKKFINPSLLSIYVCWIVFVISGCISISPTLTPINTKGTDEPMTIESVQTDIEALSQLVNLPYVPDAVMWKRGHLGPEAGDARLPAPSDGYLVLVLQYSPETIMKIKESAVLRQSPKYVRQDFIESWYPEPVANSFEVDDKTSFLILNKPYYDASIFTKSPWSQGYMFFPDHETVFVYLLAI